MTDVGLEGGVQRRYCNCCDAETEVHRSRGNNGPFEYCPRCSFPYDYASGEA